MKLKKRLIIFKILVIGSKSYRYNHLKSVTKVTHPSKQGGKFFLLSMGVLLFFNILDGAMFNLMS